MPTILVAEDDAPVRALIHRILSREGFDVLCPPNRRIAVELAAEHPGAIDLLVADLSAVGFDDPEVLEQLDTLNFEPAVLFISNAGERPPRPGSWLTKPFRPSELVRKVRKLLEKVGPKQRASRRIKRAPSPSESGTAG
ncbi:MAG TPA: response regulator [Bryobacteraceae bacterium]|nr:response regulator [Bryobacteraceae bacterium]